MIADWNRARIHRFHLREFIYNFQLLASTFASVAHLMPAGREKNDEKPEKKERVIPGYFLSLYHLSYIARAMEKAGKVWERGCVTSQLQLDTNVARGK